MFRPIKNLITYIQKNASGSAIFGGSAAVAEEADVEPIEASQEAKEQLTASKKTKQDDANKEPDYKMDKTNESEYSAEPKEEAAAPYDEEDDFELQIKSIMLKKPSLTTSTATSGAATSVQTSAALNKDTLPQRSVVDTINAVAARPAIDHNHSFDDDDELADFRYDPTANLVANDDFCSVASSAAPTVTEDDDGEDGTAEEFNTEDDEEELEEPFLDLAQEIESLADRELIVLNDGELNSSIASDALSEDPLAIDDLTQPSLRLGEIGIGANTLDSATSTTTNDEEEASTSQDLIWLNIGTVSSRAAGFDSVDGVGAKAATTAAAAVTINDVKANMCDEQTPNKCDATPSQKPSPPVTESAKKSKSDEQAEELRSDGSDSGLGSETSALQITNNSEVTTPTSLPLPTAAAQNKPENASASTAAAAAGVHNAAAKEVAAVTDSAAVVNAPKPLRSNLKRRLVEIEADDDDEVLGSGALNVAVAAASAVAAAASSAGAVQKKPKRSINFDNVQVFYFPRQQGFGCVPSAGGCTLGMAAHHVAFKTLTLAEHAAELRRAHRLQLQEINPRGVGGSSSDDSEESEEDYLSEGSGSDLDAESNGFLQPVSPKQRRALLKAAGVRKIDASEKAECRDIRNSREVCGCTCRDFCDPETCACSQAGIKCQVDRAMFPCGCSRDACGNSIGRVEFNPARVRTHFIHTIMRLEMESRQQPNRPLNTNATGSISDGMIYGMSSSTSSATTSSGAAIGQSATHYYGSSSSIQPQSNYSSGYASPAYTTDSHQQQPSAAGSYYQPQSPAATSYGIGVPSLTAAAAGDMHTSPPQYQLDSLDSSLFSGAAAATATPSYGELMPAAYGNVSVSTATAPGSFHNLNYAAIGSGIQTQVSSYSSYHQHHQHQTATAATTSSYLPQSHNSANSLSPPSSTYSSCAVPSIPPYGTATTTVAAAAPLYHSIALETTTAPSSTSVAAGIIDRDIGVSDSNFISLNTPIVSSSRLSQINDLLQHNRNTTAALVAVAQCPNASAVRSAAVATVTTSSASIDTPPIEDAHKSCMAAFEELSPPLNPTPIVAVMETMTTAPTTTTMGNKLPLPQTEPPPDDAALDSCSVLTSLAAAASSSTSTANN